MPQYNKIRKQIFQEILRKLEDGESNYKRFKATLMVAYGFTKSKAEEYFQTLEDAGIIEIEGDNIGRVQTRE